MGSFHHLRNGDQIARLIRDMKDTMYGAPGVGLAAPRVGLPLQLAVIEDREELLKNLPSAELLEKERKRVPLRMTGLRRPAEIVHLS